MPWFVKTERFLRPYLEMKPHLEAHRRWVEQLRGQGQVLSSGYLVDGEGQPGGRWVVVDAGRGIQRSRSVDPPGPEVAEWRGGVDAAAMAPCGG